MSGLTAPKMNSTWRERLHSFRTNLPENNMIQSVLHIGMDEIAKSNQPSKQDLNAKQLCGSLTGSDINFALFFFPVAKLMPIRNIELTRPQLNARLQLSILTSVINTSGLSGLDSSKIIRSSSQLFLWDVMERISLISCFLI